MTHPKSFEEIAVLLDEAKSAWIRLVGYIRVHYIMDELWTEGKSTGKLSNYRNELKFRRGGKTLVTLYVRDGFFIVSIVLGKAEREAFERERGGFSEHIQTIYDQTPALHDGKWLGLEIRDEAYIDDIIRLFNIKRRPNRKADAFSLEGAGKCGNRCDLCLLHAKNNEGGCTDRMLFHDMDWRCYHTEGEERIDHTKTVCQGCAAMCSGKTPNCANAKGLESCEHCDYRHCSNESQHIYGFEPGKCNLGLTADEVTRCVIPYCGKERFDMAKEAKT